MQLDTRSNGVHRPAETSLLDPPRLLDAPGGSLNAPCENTEPKSSETTIAPGRSIRNWLPADRPRERLLEQGAGALSNAELLAILLGSGARGGSAVDVARTLLSERGSLARLLTAPAEVLMRIDGIGPARAATLLAVVELGQRMRREAIERATLLNRPEVVADWLTMTLHGRPQEAFLVLFLDTQNRLIRMDELFRGTLNQTAVYPREIARRALEVEAAAVILAHNHPSGVAEPSSADRELTRTIRQSLQLLSISVLDHVIIAGASSYSFARDGGL